MSNINAKNINSENITVTNLNVSYINGRPYMSNCGWVPCPDCNYLGPDVCDCGNSCDYVPDDCDCFVNCGGKQGSTGAQGYQGATGVGAQGFQGATGVGAQGFQGATGVGAQGFQGATGVGAQGFQGATGVGAQGFQGATGVGAQGFQGATGVGAQGFQGATGVGAQGFQGATGVGAQGFQGATGSSGVVSASNTALLYDDFMSCPLNNPTTPIGLLGMQSSTTTTFLSPYTGTKSVGHCGVIKLLNPSSTGTVFEIYNSQPLSFNDLKQGGVPLSLTYRNFTDGTTDGNALINTNVVQYIGIFGGIAGNGTTVPFSTPNWYVTASAPVAPTTVTYNWYSNNVLQGTVTSPFSLTSWFTFSITKTGTSTFNTGGAVGTSGVTWSGSTTDPLYIRCGSYASSTATQNCYTYIDYVGVQLNTR